MDSETKSFLETIDSAVKAIAEQQRQQGRQLDAIDVVNQRRLSAAILNEDVLQKALAESDDLRRVIGVSKGRASIRVNDLNQIPLGRKMITGTSPGMAGTPGVIAPQQVGTIVPLAQRRLFLRDLLYRGNTTTGNEVYFVREQSFVNSASPQPGEGNLKAESTITFTTVSQSVVTIAHWLAASRQVMDDSPTLAAFIQQKLLYGLRYKEEVEILAGDGTGNHLTGLLTIAAQFDPALLPTGATTEIDTLRVALEQVELSDETPAGFFVLNPTDTAKIDLIKTTFGTYVVGDPGAPAATQTLWGKPVISTTAILPGTFLAGSSESAELIDRMDAVVEISFEDRDNFIRNAVTILCEERTTLCTYRPNAFVTGSFASALSSRLSSPLNSPSNGRTLPVSPQG